MSDNAACPPQNPPPHFPHNVSNHVSNDYRSPDYYDDEISLLDLAITLAKHKKLIIGLPLAVALVTAVVTLFMPTTYTATTNILPKGGTPSVYVSLLKSQPMSDTLISRFQLQKVYSAATISGTRRALTDASKIKAEADGLITVAVSDTDPVRAAALANGYAAELAPLTRRFVLTQAAERRMLLEKLLPEAAKTLADAEDALQKAKINAGNLNLDREAQGLVNAASELRARIAIKEVEFVALGGYDPAKNPNFALPQQQLTALWDELGAVEKNSILLTRVPADGQEYLRAVGELKYAETRLETLNTQIALAKVSEAKEAPVIQVLDKADVPDRKSGPKRSLIVILASISAGFIALLWAFITEALHKVKGDAASIEQLNTLRRYLSWK